MTRLKWNLVSVCLEIVLVLVQDRCTVCAKHTIGSEIILDAPDGTPRSRGSSESSFSIHLETVLVSVHGLGQIYHGSEIGLDAPDGTPT